MNSSKPNWRERLAYYFDNALGRGPHTLISWLGLVTLLFALITTTLVIAFGGMPKSLSVFGVFYNILTQALMPVPPDATNPPLYLLFMFITSLGGLFIVGALISIITTEIEFHVFSLRQGHSRIFENDHTVILGWSHQIFTVIRELILANEGENRELLSFDIIMSTSMRSMKDEYRQDKLASVWASF